MEITLKPTYKQHLAFQALQDEFIKYLLFGGGAGGGKTWLGCEWLLSLCYLFPETKWFIGREELKRLMGSTYITWVKVCKHHGIPQTDWSLNGQYNYIQFKNGSRIDLLDLKYEPSDPLYERFGSVEYTGGWIEEGSEVEFAAFDVLKSRVGRHLNVKYNIPGRILITCNPTKKWLYRIFYKPFKDGTLQRSYAFVQSLYQDNPHTAQTYGKELAEIDNEATKQRLMYGNWEFDDEPRKLFEFKALQEMFFTKLPPSSEKFLTIDVARHGEDRAVICRWEGWTVKQFLVFPKCDIDFLQQQARSVCDEHIIMRANVLADEDGVGGGFVDNFKCRGFLNNSSPIQPPELEFDKTKRVNYQNLKTQCIFELAKKVNGRQIAIEDRRYMDDIIQECEQIKEVASEGKLRVTPKEEIRESIGRSPDLFDSLLMRCWYDIAVEGKSFEPVILKFTTDRWGRKQVV